MYVSRVNVVMLHLNSKEPEKSTDFHPEVRACVRACNQSSLLPLTYNVMFTSRSPACLPAAAVIRACCCTSAAAQDGLCYKSSCMFTWIFKKNLFSRGVSYKETTFVYIQRFSLCVCALSNKCSECISHSTSAGTLKTSKPTFFHCRLTCALLIVLCYISRCIADCWSPK